VGRVYLLGLGYAGQNVLRGRTWITGIRETSLGARPHIFTPLQAEPVIGHPPCVNAMPHQSCHFRDERVGELHRVWFDVEVHPRLCQSHIMIPESPPHTQSPEKSRIEMNIRLVAEGARGKDDVAFGLIRDRGLGPVACRTPPPVRAEIHG
jgi:hypothetical protein